MTHQLRGNTELHSLGRGLSASHHPSRLAAWTLPKARNACERFFFEVYPQLVHGSLGATPRDVFNHAMAVAGERVARHVVVDLALRALLAESPHCGGPTRRVDGSRGVFVGYLWYWHPVFSQRALHGTPVEVKVFPDDCGEILALVHGEWRRCHVVDGGADLAGRSWRQIEMVIQVLRAQHKVGRSRAAQRINAKVIGAFLADLGETEEELAVQRQVLLDQENALATASAHLSPDGAQLRLAAVDGEPVDPSDGADPSSAPCAPHRKPPPNYLDFDTLESLDED